MANVYSLLLTMLAAAAAGQLPDALASEVKTMNRRLAVFHDLTNGQVLRSCWFV